MIQLCVILLTSNEGSDIMVYHFLLVEDDMQISEVICDYFSDKSGGGIEITVAADGLVGLERIRSQDYDLIMLDIMLPGMDGFSLCREIRSKSIVPVLFLTARGKEEDLLYGYELGCDDYIIKPFSLAELYVKTQALVKRSKGMVISKEMVCGKIRMDLVRFVVTAEEEVIDLAPKEYALLRYLMEHQGWVVDRDTLLDRVWGQDFEGMDRVVDNHIKKLRKALGSAGGQIRTVFTKGYKLVE